MPFFVLIERIVKLRIKTSQDGHFEFQRRVIPTPEPIVALWLQRYSKVFLKKTNKQGNKETNVQKNNNKKKQTMT